MVDAVNAVTEISAIGSIFHTLSTLDHFFQKNKIKLKLEIDTT
jgi:hypothetical protein